VQPDFINTELYRHKQRAAEQISDYDLWQQGAFKPQDQYVRKAPDPTLAAECRLRIVENKAPPTPYTW